MDSPMRSADLAELTNDPSRFISSTDPTPILFVKDGVPAFVLQSAKEYQKLVDEASAQALKQAIAAGTKDVEDGKVIPIDEVFNRLENKYGV